MENNNNNNKLNYKGYRRTSSKSGELTIHIKPRLARRIGNYCELKNISKTRFVESCVEQILLREEKNALEKMTREQLIHLILSERG
jgi:hypothetical protein